MLAEPAVFPTTADRLRSLLTAGVYDFYVGTDLVLYRHADGCLRRLMLASAACGVTSFDEFQSEADFMQWEDAFERLEQMATERGETLFDPRDHSAS